MTNTEQKLMISEQQLQQQIDELNQEISPKRDLWIGIERAIEQQSSVPKTSAKVHVAWAATLFLSVSATWFVWQQPATNTVAQQSSIVQGSGSALVSGFEQQKQTLLVSLGQPDLTALSPKIQAQFDELSSARAALHKALADDPENADLLNLLTWLQQQELALLEQLYRPKWQTI